MTAAAFATTPSVPVHDADLPRVAIYSNWTGTQEIGWVRYTFDRFGVPFDLIYKERVRKGNLRTDYDVIVMPPQTLTRQSVFQPPAAKAVPYQKDPKYKFLGMYGESPDITGGMGGEGVDALAKFLDAGGTLVTMGTASRFPADLGLARTVDASATTSANFYAPRPLVNAEVLRLDHPVFYGYTDKLMPIKYIQGQPLLSVSEADRGTVLARYVGGDAAVLSGLMRGADEIRERPLAIDVAWRLHRQRPRDHVRQQPDLPLAEPRRVQHGVQRAAELERHGLRGASDGGHPVKAASTRRHGGHGDARREQARFLRGQTMPTCRAARSARGGRRPSQRRASPVDRFVTRCASPPLTTSST